MLFDIIAIRPKSPNSQTENFGSILNGVLWWRFALSECF